VPEVDSADPPVEARRRLIEAFGPRAKLLPHERRLYGYDATGVCRIPGAVVHAQTPEDVAAVVGIVRDLNLTLVARGAGTGLSGGSVPETGGIVLSFEDMRGVGAVDATLLTVWVEPGVINQTLENTLAPLGLFYPPDPASYRVSTIGGNIAENAGGPRAVKYGVTGHHVRRVAVVDPEGCAGELTAGEYQPGSDLVSVVVGSEGTLAILTGAELSLRRRPDTIATLLVSFNAMLQATRFVSAVIARGTIPLAIEFLDRANIEAIETWGVASYPPGAEAVVLLDVEGTEESVAADAEAIRELAVGLEAMGVEVARDETEREALWLGRRGSFAATALHGRRILIQDVTVPREHLTDILAEIDRIGAKYGILVSTKGHAGDGNLHPDLPYDPDDADMDRRVHQANLEILKACVALGGSITGEHGIGFDKLHQLPLMYDQAELGLMWAVKTAIDPNGRFNPGKAVLPADRVAPETAGRRYHRPKTAKEVRSAVWNARATRKPVEMSLEAFRAIEPDPANMTVTVGAGVTAKEIADALAGTPLSLPVTPLRGGTIARAILGNDYGPEHVAHGTFRRSLLEVKYVTGAGELVRMGRPIMKNVAGYDLYRLLIGSRGAFGIPVSFTLRLVPRVAGRWFARRLEADRILDTVLPAGPEAVFACSQNGSGALSVFGCFAGPVAGWEETPGAGALLEGAAASLGDGDDFLDLAFPARMLSRVLPLLEEPPVIVLPAAARLLVRASRDEARTLTARVEAFGDGPVRAVWGPRLEPLHTLGRLEAAWEGKLRRVFDPDGILSVWLT